MGHEGMGGVGEESTSAAAQRIRAEALELVRCLLDASLPVETLRERGRELDQQIKALVGRPGHGEPDVQQALSDADLDIGFVFAGGEGALSTTADQLRRERDEGSSSRTS